MAEKQLTEADWKAFAKGKSYKDAPLLKALAALDKLAKAGPDAQAEALDDIEKQADLLRKANKGDKELGSHLDGLEKALAKERKSVDAERAKAATSEAEEEEESPALLTTKMVPLLRQVRKGDAMQVLIGVAGKDTAVLLSRRAISTSRNKLLKDFLGGGGVKFVRGECVFENNAHTFVVATQAAGLAKKVRAALLAQTEMRLKVRVRGEDPADIDEDGEDAGDEATAGSDDAAATKPGAAPPAPPGPAETCATRLALLQPRVARAVSDGSPLTAKLRALLAFAEGKAAAGDPLAALQALLSLEKLLDAPVPAASQDTNVDAGDAFTARLAALMPKIREAMAGPEPRAGTVKLKAGEAGARAKAKDYTSAQTLLDEIETLLAGAAASSAAPAAATGAAAQWASRVDGVQARLLQVLATQPANASALRAVMAYAVEQAEGGDHAKALVALGRLDGLLAGVQTAAENAPAASRRETGYTGIVAYQTSLINFRAAAAKVEAAIGALQFVIPSEMPEEADMARDLSAALRDYTAGLLDAVDEAVRTSENTQAPVTQALVDRLADYAADVAVNELIGHVDDNPFGVELNIRKTLGSALAAVQESMPSLAG